MEGDALSALRVTLWSVAIIVISVPVIVVVWLTVSLHHSQDSDQHRRDQAHVKALRQAQLYGADLKLASTTAVPDVDDISALARTDHVQYVRSSVQGQTLTAYVVSSSAYGTLFGAGHENVCVRVTITDAGSASAQDQVTEAGGSCYPSLPASPHS
jgi:hypothetical protein